ncbi:muscarinic acetylcholine receptor M2-like [Anguilla anguilla]|uniref:muscarinic acetylcholine receptor M2-like n=1 Tax=Anguilla anguilla TaxID=7936 RepID=UPI0015AD88E8|nr:muscarinic acetylcholine receptor M2-like [Anguilla anguilla]
MEQKNNKLALSTASNVSNSSAGNDTATLLPEAPYQAVEVVFIVLVAGSLSLVTIIGNILVMLSIILNRNLQTINNYFLFSLACADLIIGVSSMNLNTVYIVIGYWPLGPVVCDLWLVQDYVVCTASTMNLLIISLDRYFSVTKPLSYPMKRTTKMAGMMIAVAWVLSFFLWAPAILFWPFIVGVRTVPDTECYIQFFFEPTITIGTAIASFYLPVAIIMMLYWQVSRASKSCVKTGKYEPSGSKQENPSSTEVGDHISTPDDDDDDVETQGTDRSRNGGAPHTVGGVRGGQEEVGGAQNPDSCMSDRGPGQLGRNGIAMATRNPAVCTIVTVTKQPPKKKAAPSREKKVTRTVMAILVAFVVTYAPYHIMVFMNTICSTCVPNAMWTFSYWLCYINSTVNPACYALCNATFKKTFKQLLLSQYKDNRFGR